jgi:sugar phosphate isomerase/epimerase
MKLAYMMATADAAPFPLAWNGAAEVIVDRVAAIGYAGLEVQICDPAAVDGQRLARLCADAGLTLCGVSTGQAALRDGLSLMAPEADVRRAAIDRLRHALELGAELGCHVSIGVFRGQVATAPSRAIALGWLTDALTETLPLAESLGIRIVLEPMQRFHRDSLNTIAETIGFIRTFDSPALTYEADLHHQQIEERSLIASLVIGQRSGLMTHVQVSDSNWLAPGRGNYNWVDLLETLRGSGYDGWIACECLQEPDSERCAMQAYATLRNALDGFALS